MNNLPPTGSHIQNIGMRNITFYDAVVLFSNQCLQNQPSSERKNRSTCQILERGRLLTVHTTPLDSLMTSRNANVAQDKKTKHEPVSIQIHPVTQNVQKVVYIVRERAAISYTSLNSSSFSKPRTCDVLRILLRITARFRCFNVCFLQCFP